jgi:hypothetical protein
MRRAGSLFVLALMLTGTTFGLSEAAPADDGNGREWRQLYETTGLTWAQVARICPRDGETPCSGSVGGKVLTGWVWATQDQVIDFMGQYAPELLTAEPPTVSGPEYFLPALGFLSKMRWTLTQSSTYFSMEWTGGWTSSTDQDGRPTVGAAGYQHPIFNGHLGVGSVANADESDPHRGVWLWREAGLDYSPPVISSTVDGVKGTNDWYVSSVSVAWDVKDAESPIDSTTGCEPSEVVSDTPNATFRCTARSFGGASEASLSIKRDATPPVVACGAPAPVFDLGQLGAAVTASVSDATSGPVTSAVKGFANTGRVGTFSAPVVGRDTAGNRTTTNCKYEVVVPYCRNLVPSIVGSTGNDVIEGTIGRDIIHSIGGLDTINGLAGNDVICGGDGPDSIYGGRGKDSVDGGPGDDSLFGSPGDDKLNGGPNNDRLRGDSGRDTCASGEIGMSSCEIEIP